MSVEMGGSPCQQECDELPPTHSIVISDLRIFQKDIQISLNGVTQF